MKYLSFLLVFFIIGITQLNAQVSPSGETEDAGSGSKRRFSKPKEKKEKAKIEWYKIISSERDSIHLDTTLTIQKEYKFNYLRKDDFELVPSPNIGKPYTQLAKQSQYFDVTPAFGARTRHIAYVEAQDINYYRAPTPLTELYYKTALEQGQQLDAFLTINTSPQLNFSLAYKGIRSLGSFQNSLTSTTAFRSTLSYNSKNGRYVANAHFTDQSILNEENGGLTDLTVEDFKTGGDNFSDRPALEVNFENAENTLEGLRLYLDHEYRILRPDTLQNNELAIRHKTEYTVKDYTFSQQQATEEFFGAAQNIGAFRDKTELSQYSNQLGIHYSNKYLGKIDFFIKQTNYNYGYNSVFVRNSETDGVPNEIITNRLQGNITSLGASYKNTYKGFLLEGDIHSGIVGTYNNQYFLGTAGYQYKEDIALRFGYKITSEVPNYNQLLYQSNYVDYIWQNDFDNTLTNTFLIDVKSKRLFDLEGSLSLIDKYTYFSRTATSEEIIDSVTDESTLVFVSTPVQTNSTLQLIKLKAYREFKVGNFALANTVLYQKVTGNNGNAIYNVPDIVTRNSLYYQNEVFKRAMFLQTGFTFKYFSEYYADGYDPLIAENFSQNSEKFGGYPSVDFFLNSKVRQTRIFFKLENMQSLFRQNTELVAPNYPTRDFLIRFGLVWNFFL